MNSTSYTKKYDIEFEDDFPYNTKTTTKHLHSIDMNMQYLFIHIFKNACL